LKGLLSSQRYLPLVFTSFLITTPIALGFPCQSVKPFWAKPIRLIAGLLEPTVDISTFGRNRSWAILMLSFYTLTPTVLGKDFTPCSKLGKL